MKAKGTGFNITIVGFISLAVSSLLVLILGLILTVNGI